MFTNTETNLVGRSTAGASFTPRLGTRARRVLASVAGTVCMTAILATAAPPANAGTNGLQIDLNIPYGRCGAYGPAADVTITGPNQNGQVVTWRRPGSFPTGAYIANWWWRGRVTVVWRKDGTANYYRTTAYVPATHDATLGRYQDIAFVNCTGTIYFPVYWRFNNLGGKVFLLLSPAIAYDPRFHKYVSRSYTFGYWAGHYVYKITNSVGTDINTGKLILAQSTQHLIVFRNAFGSASGCWGIGMPGVPPELMPAKAAISAWCGVGGAISTFLH